MQATDIRKTGAIHTCGRNFRKTFIACSLPTAIAGVSRDCTVHTFIQLTLHCRLSKNVPTGSKLRGFKFQRKIGGGGYLRNLEAAPGISESSRRGKGMTAYTDAVRTCGAQPKDRRLESQLGNQIPQLFSAHNSRTFVRHRELRFSSGSAGCPLKAGSSAWFAPRRLCFVPRNRSLQCLLIPINPEAVRVETGRRRNQKSRCERLAT
jgi:hypothetical protein